MRQTDKALLKQLAQWHEDDEYQKIVDTILGIPENDRDYELTGQLARALNNLGELETAVEILLSVEEEGDKDPLWHYRLGYAYFYSSMFSQAKEEFEKVLQLTPDDADAMLFLEWCKEEMSPTVKTDKLNARLMVVDGLMAGVTFRQRTDDFWKWFTCHEAELADMVDKCTGADTDKIIELVSEGVKLIGEEVNFNIGGNYEFTFTVEGNNYLFYLLPWLVARMPGRFRDKWHFFPYMQGTNGQSFGFQMYDKNIPLEKVMVGLHYNDEENFFDVRFYQEDLCQLPDDQGYDAFYIMMELTIGEGMARIYVNQVEKAENLEKGMFPLTKLENCITMALEEAKKDILLRPDERYTVYRMDFDELKDLRYDMLIGNTCFTELVRDYFNEETTNTDKLNSYGAKAVFLVVPIGETDRSELLKLRYDIEDCLIAKILGERGSGQEIGIVLGGVTGEDYLYVDLLLYDTPAFINRASVLLLQFPYPFYMAEFRPESRLVALAGVEAEIPRIPESPSELAREMMDYLDCSCDWFAPTADSRILDKAYFVALEAGREDGYIPVLVKVDEALMELLKMGIRTGRKEGTVEENIGDYRREMSEKTILPDAKAYFDRFIAESESVWQKNEGGKSSAEEEEPKGYNNHYFFSYWNSDVSLTHEVLLVRIPVKEIWKIFAWLPVGGGQGCPDTVTMMAIVKYWNEVHGAVPAIITSDEMEFYVPGPVADEQEAVRLAKEQIVFCPLEEDINGDTIARQAETLRNSGVWYFWWGMKC